MSETPHPITQEISDAEKSRTIEAVYRYLLDHIPMIAALFFLYGIYGDLSELKRDRYTLPMAEADSMREAMANPGHRVPDPRNPGQYFVVEDARIINHFNTQETPP